MRGKVSRTSAMNAFDQALATIKKIKCQTASYTELQRKQDLREERLSSCVSKQRDERSICDQAHQRIFYYEELPVTLSFTCCVLWVSTDNSLKIQNRQKYRICCESSAERRDL